MSPNSFKCKVGASGIKLIDFDCTDEKLCASIYTKFTKTTMMSCATSKSICDTDNDDEKKCCCSSELCNTDMKATCSPGVKTVASFGFVLLFAVIGKMISE